MSDYTEFKIESLHNDKSWYVKVKGGWWDQLWGDGYKSGFVHTNYFSLVYASKQECIDAIARYKSRHHYGY